MKKYKYILLILILFIITGCTNINNFNYDEVVASASQSSALINQVRKGYKYYLPKGLKVLKSDSYNEILMDSDYKYYLYVDVISFYNNIKASYKETDKAFYSRSYENGYLEINHVNDDKYLIEIMNNYAKIEVIVEESDIRDAVCKASIVLFSIEYKYDVLDSMLKDEIINNNEVLFDIFSTTKSESDFSLYQGEYGNDNKIKDSDLIE